MIDMSGHSLIVHPEEGDYVVLGEKKFTITTCNDFLGALVNEQFLYTTTLRALGGIFYTKNKPIKIERVAYARDYPALDGGILATEVRIALSSSASKKKFKVILEEI